jgi:Imm-5 like putative immunity protein
MKTYSREEQRAMAAWAAKCAERVLPLFEKEYPKDDRPRKAIEACRTWIRTGVFRMADIRGASLGAHAAARGAKENSAACFAARAAGHSVATAHVPQHAYGSAYYALKAAAASDLANAETTITRERNWQSGRLPRNLKQVFIERIIITKNKRGIIIKIKKGEGF